MIPSIVTRQVQRGIRDYIKTAFPAYDAEFAGAFDALASEGAKAPVCAVKAPVTLCAAKFALYSFHKQQGSDHS